MKPTSLLLSLSLVANVALLALVVVRTNAPSVPSPGPLAPAQKTNPSSAAQAEAIRAALASGDAAALAAVGIPPDIAHDLAVGRTFSRMAEKVRAARTKKSEGQWWRPRSSLGDPGSREQQLVARRELSDALIAAFGDDLGLAGADQSQLAFLAPEKRDALRRINQDYDEMMAKFSGGGVQLASDREKLRLLRLERDRDIAQLLTPEERAGYEMRTSTSASMVKSRYGDAIESEAEFQKIYALQKAFDDKFPREALTGRITPEVMRSRAEAERQMEAEMRTALGDDRYAALRRAADSDLRTIDALASRLNLPATTTDNVLASRDNYSAESQRINNDTSLTMPQRRAQIQSLATQAKAELTRTLGHEAADAYAQRSSWLNMLQNGMAYSTTPQDGTPGSLFPGPAQSVYPVMPAGIVPGNAQRQFVINAAPSDQPLSTDTVVTGGNVQVMSFSSAVSADPLSTPAAGASVRQVIVPPGSQGATPPPAAAPTPPR